MMFGKGQDAMAIKSGIYCLFLAQPGPYDTSRFSLLCEFNNSLMIPLFVAELLYHSPVSLNALLPMISFIKYTTSNEVPPTLFASSITD